LELLEFEITLKQIFMITYIVEQIQIELSPLA